MPGSRAITEKLHGLWMKDILVCNDTAIPKSLKVTERVPCWRLHPGLCAHLDKWCYQEVLAVGRVVENYLVQGSKVLECPARSEGNACRPGTWGTHMILYVWPFLRVQHKHPFAFDRLARSGGLVFEVLSST